MKIITYTRINKCEKYIGRENHCFHRCGAPSVSHQAPRFPLTGAGPKREQNLIHSEPKAVPDRFTLYSRFGEIYNGKRCYRILRRTYLLDFENSHVRPFFLFHLTQGRRKRESCRKKNKLNHILRLLSSRIIFVSFNTRILLSLETVKQYETIKVKR